MNQIPTLSIIALMTLASNAPASAQAFEGRYANRAYGQTLTVKMMTPSTYRVTLNISAPGCIGHVNASATMVGQNLQTSRGLASERPYAGETPDTCQLTFMRTPKGITVKEQTCSYFHGMRCDFTGEYTKR